MVIVEYCKHGNLSSYLKSKRGEYSPFKVNMEESVFNVAHLIYSLLRSYCQSNKNINPDDLLTKVHMSSYMLLQKHRPQLMQDKAGGTEVDLNEGDLGMGTTARLDICTGTAICSGLRNENPQLYKQGTASQL